MNPSSSGLEGIADEELLARFEELHRGVYQVYRLGTDRSAIHDLLSERFAGALLTREYIEHWTAAAAMARDHIGFEVVRIDYESLEVIAREPGRVQIAADWSVGGVVSHRDHRHPRVNRYRATYWLGAPRAGGAKDLLIVASHLRSLARERGGGPGIGDSPPTSARGYMTAEELLRSGALDELLEEPRDGSEDE